MGCVRTEYPYQLVSVFSSRTSFQASTSACLCFSKFIAIFHYLYSIVQILRCWNFDENTKRRKQKPRLTHNNPCHITD